MRYMSTVFGHSRVHAIVRVLLSNMPLLDSSHAHMATILAWLFDEEEGE